MKRLSLFDVVFETLIASLYFLMVVIPVFTPFSFGLVQFRLAEILMILALFHKKHRIGLTLGCLIANYYGLSLGQTTIFDVIFGTLATFLSALMMYHLRSFFLLALLMPAIINGIIVGIILSYAFTSSLGPLYVTIPSVFFGEIVVLYALGLPFYLLIKKRHDLLELLSK